MTWHDDFTESHGRLRLDGLQVSQDRDALPGLRFHGGPGVRLRLPSRVRQRRLGDPALGRGAGAQSLNTAHEQTAFDAEIISRCLTGEGYTRPMCELSNGQRFEHVKSSGDGSDSLWRGNWILPNPRIRVFKFSTEFSQVNHDLRYLPLSDFFHEWAHLLVCPLHVFEAANCCNDGISNFPIVGGYLKNWDGLQIGNDRFEVSGEFLIWPLGIEKYTSEESWQHRHYIRKFNVICPHRHDTFGLHLSCAAFVGRSIDCPRYEYRKDYCAPRRYRRLLEESTDTPNQIYRDEEISDQCEGDKCPSLPMGCPGSCPFSHIDGKVPFQIGRNVTRHLEIS